MKESVDTSIAFYKVIFDCGMELLMIECTGRMHWFCVVYRYDILVNVFKLNISDVGFY